ncbi:MAG: hypothetical protein WB766_21675 [Roseiarcus sp.]
MDFVAPDLDFVAPGLDFVAAGLDFGVFGLDFGVLRLETSGAIAAGEAREDRSPFYFGASR